MILLKFPRVRGLNSLLWLRIAVRAWATWRDCIRATANAATQGMSDVVAPAGASHESGHRDRRSLWFWAAVLR